MEPDHTSRRGRNYRSRYRPRGRGGASTNTSTPGDPFAPRQQVTADPFSSSRPTTTPGDPFARQENSQFGSDSFGHAAQKSAFGGYAALQPTGFGDQGAFGSATQQSTFASAAAQPSAFGAAPSQPTAFGAPAAHPTVFGVPSAPPSAFGASALQPAGFDASASRAAGFGAPAQPTGFGATESEPNPFQSGAASDPFAPRQSFGVEEKWQGPFRVAGEGDPFAPKPSRAPAGPHDDRGPRFSTKLMLTKVPQWMFSREGVLTHFKKLPDVNPLDVSIRGSAKTKEAKRTAVISFATPEEATLAMKHARYYSGNMLQLKYFREGPNPASHPAPQPDEYPVEARQSSRPPSQPSPMSNELLFSYVPEELFSEEAVRHLFNSISSNQVVTVSIRSKPNRGSVKRTAIIRFPDIAGAKTALESLPSYKGQQLQVVYRNKPPHLIKKQHYSNPGSSSAGRNSAGRNSESDDMSVMFGSASPSPMHEAVMDAAEGKAFPRSEFVMQPKEEASSWGQPLEDEDAKPYTYADGADVPSEWYGDAVDEALRAPEDGRELEKARLRKMIADRERQNARKNRSARSKGKKFEATREVAEEERVDLKARRGAEEIGRKHAHASKQIVREENNNGGAWRNVGEKVDLNKAVQFVGTCQTMCPEKEISERILRRDISVFETVDGHGGDPDPSRAVKKYRRSAAISELPQPQEVRPPPVLVRTMEYLKGICDSADSEFVDIHNFVRDRTRSLRQDFTFQGIRDDSCIRIHEESVRFHIMSEHRLTGTDPAKFSSKQNREQLDKCFISLREMYDLRREHRLPTSPNEPEMQAYYMLTQMSDPKTCVQLCTGFAVDVRRSLSVQFALHVVKAASDSFGNYFGYFACVRSAPYLMACLMHSRFTRIRCQALAVINSTHGNPASPDTLDVSSLKLQLGFEDEDETIRFCSLLGIDVITVDASGRGGLTKAISTPSPDFDSDNGRKWVTKRSDVMIESKSNGLKPSEIIAGAGTTQFDLFQLPHINSSHMKQLSVKRKEQTLEPVDAASSASPSATKSVGQGLGKATNLSLGRTKSSILGRLGTATGKPPAFPTVIAPSRMASQPDGQDASKEVSTKLTKANGEPDFKDRGRVVKRPLLSSAFAPTHKNDKLPVAAPFASLAHTDVQEMRTAKKVSFDMRLSGPAYMGPDQIKFARPDLPTQKPFEISRHPKKPAADGVQQPNAFDSTHQQRYIEVAQPQRDAHEQHVAAAALLKHDEEGANLRRDAEAARRQRLAEEALWQHQQELSSARKQSTEDRSTVEAYKEFEQLIEETAAKSQILKERLLEIQRRCKSLSLEKDGPSKALQQCEEASVALTSISDALRDCINEMERTVPITELGATTKRQLVRSLRAMGDLGEKVWKQVWSIKGLAIVTPIGASNRVPVFTTGQTLERKSPLLTKRKASDENEDMPDSKNRALSVTKYGAVWKASKIARTEKGHSSSEFDGVVAAMQLVGLVRWQAVIMEGPWRKTKAETRTRNWVKQRLAEKSGQQYGVLRLLSKRDDCGTVHLSVKEMQVGVRIPPTANVVIFAVDLSSIVLCEERGRWIEESLSKRKNSAVLIGSLTPVLILLHEDNRTDLVRKPGSGASGITARLTSLVDRGLISDYHIVDVSITCTEFIEQNVKFSSALARTVDQTQEAMKAKAQELNPCSMGEYLVQHGNSAWIRFISTYDRIGNEESSHNEVIDNVNAAWSAVAKTVGEEERRWPEEMSTERKRLLEMRLTLRRKMRLPLPSEVNATTSKDYITELAKRAGVACPTLRYTGARHLSQFCRVLGHLLMPYVSSVLHGDYFTVIYLPRTSLPPSNAALYYKLRHRLINVGKTDLNPSAAVERTWDGTPFKTRKDADPVSQKMRSSFGPPIKEPVLRRALSMKKMHKDRGVSVIRPRRNSLELLSRTLDFSPPAKNRRSSLPVPGDNAREMYSLYDEMCKTEESHSAMLDETIAMLLSQTNRSVV